MVQTSVQTEILKQLKTMRYGNEQQKQARASRPKKSQKLPAGASYTCMSEAGDYEVMPAVIPDDELEEEEVSSRARSRGRAAGRKRARDGSSSDSSSDRYSSISDQVEEIYRRLGDDLNLNENEEQEDEGQEGEGKEQEEGDGEDEEGDSEDEESVSGTGTEISVLLGQGMGLGRRVRRGRRRLYQEKEDISVTYPVGTYVVAIYQNKWFVGQVLDKTAESRALPGQEYLYVNYMERSDSNALKWPQRVDKLNTHKNDVLFCCSAPTPSTHTSSTRSLTYSLSNDDLKKADELFLSKDFITSLFTCTVLTNFSFSVLIFFFLKPNLT